MTAEIASRATVDRFETHETGGYDMLTIGPRHQRPISDDLALGVQHRSLGPMARRSVLLSRAQARELADWLSRWLEQGWPGVARVEGPTSRDVIAHYEDIAVRERLAADRARIDAARTLDAALALIPPDRRDTDLAGVAAEQSRMWRAQQDRIDGLESCRVGFVQALHDMQYAPSSTTTDQFRAAARKTLDRYAHPKVKPPPGQVPDAPVYEVVRLDDYQGPASEDGAR